MSQFGVYSGKEFLALELKPRQWLVENLIRELDTVILVGNEKSGKSLFIFQLICSLTTCYPFIDKYAVPNPVNVTYIQLEGELSDSQERFKRMIKTLDLDPDKFQLMFLPPQDMQDINCVGKIRDAIDKFHKPGLIIIDPIYFAFNGKLIDDEVVRKFIGNMRILKDYFNCSILLVHHTHKMRWTYNGDTINEGDEAMFGSKFFKAWADHTLLFIYEPEKGTRTLSCNTQRSGDIIKQCSMRLIEPDPLYFEQTDKEPTKDFTLVELLAQVEDRGLTPDELANMSGMNRSTVYSSIKKLLVNGNIAKLDGTRPVKYKLIKKPTLQ